MDAKEVTIIIKWSGKEFPIEDLTEHDTVAVLRHEICKRTQVRPERQKLLNLKHKGESFFRQGPADPFLTFVPSTAGKPVTDDVRLGVLELKPNFKLMMVSRGAVWSAGH